MSGRMVMSVKRGRGMRVVMRVETVTQESLLRHLYLFHPVIDLLSLRMASCPFLGCFVRKKPFSRTFALLSCIHLQSGRGWDKKKENFDSSGGEVVVFLVFLVSSLVFCCDSIVSELELYVQNFMAMISNWSRFSSFPSGSLSGEYSAERLVEPPPPSHRTDEPGTQTV